MGGSGNGVLLRTKLAGEAEGDAQLPAGRAGPEREVLQFGIGTVYLRANAGTNHDAYDRIRDRGLETNGDSNRHLFPALDDAGGLAVGPEGFQGQDFGAAVAAAKAGGDRCRSRLAGGAPKLGDVAEVDAGDLPGVALGGETSLVEPPDFIGEVGKKG